MDKTIGAEWSTRRRRPYFWFILRIIIVAWARIIGKPVIPYKVTVEATRRCNALCKHCNISREPHIAGELDSDEIIKSVSSLGTHLFWLNITGGEPTLRSDLATIVRTIVKTCPHLFLVNMPLNGRLPDRTFDIVKQLAIQNPEVLFHVTLSLDGIDSLQDDLRGHHQWARTQASWEKLHQLRQEYNNLRVSFQSTISSMNAHQAIELLKRCADISDTYAIAFAIESQFYGNQGSGVAFTHQISDALKVVSQLAHQYPVHLTQPETIFVKLFLYGQLARLTTSKTNVPCSAGSATVTLKADGHVLPCLFLGEEAMGNVREQHYDLPTILLTKKANALRTQVATCNKCWVNCEAVPSMLSSPLSALSFLRGGWLAARATSFSSQTQKIPISKTANDNNVIKHDL